jgi:hypothetical protein
VPVRVNETDVAVAVTDSGQAGVGLTAFCFLIVMLVPPGKGF